MEFARKIGSKKIKKVLIIPSKDSKPFQCHSNNKNGILGYYYVKDSHGFLHAFKHTVSSDFVDNTPVFDDRKYNIFSYGSSYNYEHLTYDGNSVYVNKYKPESELLFYVYKLIDPRSNKPFYIGKGEDNRCLDNFKENILNQDLNSRKIDKIKKLNKLGYKPQIEFIAQNLEDEELASNIEEYYIKKYSLFGHKKEEFEL